MSAITVNRIVDQNMLHELQDKISTVLSKAFYTDPNYQYIMPNPEKRFSQIKWWMEIMLRYGFKYGEVYVSSGIEGAAIWLGPNYPLVNDFQIARMGLICFPLKIGMSGLTRMLHVMNKWEQLHKQELAKHMYLMIVGVDPDFQGKGIGSALLAPVLAKADRDGLTCYLETVTERDVRFYQKNDFVIVNHGFIDNRVEYRTMRRNAANSSPDPMTGSILLSPLTQ